MSVILFRLTCVDQGEEEQELEGENAGQKGEEYTHLSFSFVRLCHRCWNQSSLSKSSAVVVTNKRRIT